MGQNRGRFNINRGLIFATTEATLNRENSIFVKARLLNVVLEHVPRLKDHATFWTDMRGVPTVDSTVSTFDGKRKT